MAAVSDEAFARAINQMGAATLDQIEAAQREQALRAQSGKPAALGDVLVEQGIIPSALRENVEKKLLAQQQGGLKSLGNYKLIKKLGEGGMGAVYLADDTVMGRKVALKVLPKKYASDPEFLQRFRREAKSAGKLNHVNIISAFTVGEELGNHFYVMEFCEGEPLDKLLKREGVLPWDRAIEITIMIARGLQHAHEHGLIHRDIKPANIFMAAGAGSTIGKGSGSIAKILDMGLSKDIGGGEQSFNTQTGVALGTPHYISPEQAKGEKTVDGRTDIYSLGATLYHLVTGQTPFTGSTAAMIIMKHLSEQLPNPQDIRDDIPDGVVQVIQKMMAKDAADRYGDCGELLADLELVIDGKSPSSVAIDVGKSSIAIARSPRRKAAAPPGGARRAGTNRHEPVAVRRAGTPEMTPAKKSNTALFTAAGACVLGLGILIYALGGKTKTPDIVKPDETTPPVIPDNPKTGPVITTVNNSKPALPESNANSAKLLPKLVGTYYDGMELEKGRRLLQRLDADVNFSWNTGSPAPEIPPDKFSVRWDGVLNVEKPGHYTLKTLSDDGVRLTIDRKVLIDAWRVGDDSRQNAEADLSAGPHAITLEYFEHEGAAYCHLSWALKGGFPEQIIPTYNLFHTPEQEGGEVATNPRPPGVNDPWIAMVQKLPAEKQVEEVLKKLKELNPGYDGKEEHDVKNNKIGGLIISGNAITNISPLRAIRSEHISVRGARIGDISALKDVGARYIDLNDTTGDLATIEGMDLEFILIDSKAQNLSSLKNIKIKSIDIAGYQPTLHNPILKSITTLQTINGMPAAEFWKKYEGVNAGAVTDEWIKSVQALPPEKQVEEVVKKLKELNPGYDGSYSKRFSDNNHRRFFLGTEQSATVTSISNIEPLRGLPSLSELDLRGLNINSIDALKDMRLTNLALHRMPVADIAPLQKMPLAFLDLYDIPVGSLAPLKGMRLIRLHLFHSKVADLSPLSGMKLEDAVFSESPISDLSPLQGMPLKTLRCDFRPERDGAILKSIKTLEKINDMPAVEFWKKYDGAAAQKSVLLSEDFENLDLDNLRAGWTVQPKAEISIADVPGHGKALHITRKKTDKGSAHLGIVLDPALVKGHSLRASVMAYCPQGFTPVPDAVWAEPRVHIIADSDERCVANLHSDRRDWIQLVTPVWKIGEDKSRVAVLLDVPFIAADVFFDNLCVEIDPDPKSKPPAAISAAETSRLRAANIDPARAAKAIDLLSLFDPKLDSVRGNPRLAKREFLTGPEAPMIAQFPYSPPDEYDVHVEFTPQTMNGYFQIVCSKAGHSFRWSAGKIWSHFEGIAAIDLPKTPGELNAGTRYSVLLQVRNDGTRAFVNDKPAGEMREKYTSANLDLLPDKRLMGLCTHNNPTIIHRFDVIEVTGAGQLTRLDDAARWNGAVDLLALVDPVRDTVLGDWSVKNGELSCEPKLFARIEVPFAPPEEYDVRLEFTRRDVGHVLNQILQQSGKPFIFSLSPFHKCTLFELIDGKDAAHENPSIARPEALYEANRRYVSIVSVRKDGVKAYVDGKLITEWKTDGHDLSLNQAWALRGNAKMGLGSGFGGVTFHSYKLLPVLGQGKILHDGETARWKNAIDLMPLIDPDTDGMVGNWERKNGVLVSDASNGARLEIPYNPPKEYELRVTYTPTVDQAVLEFLSRNDRPFAFDIHPDRTAFFYTQGEAVIMPAQAANPTRFLQNGLSSLNIRHVSVIRVTAEGASVTIDGVAVSKWNNFAELGVWSALALRSPSLLGVGSWQNPTNFHSIEILELSGTGTFTRQNDPAAKEAKKKQDDVSARQRNQK